MKTAAKFITLPLVLVGMSLMCTTCKEKKTREPEVIYYDVTGVGYAFMYDDDGNILYPIQGVEVAVHSVISWRLHSLGDEAPIEISFSDITGKYQVRFIKSFRNDDVEYYSFFVNYYLSDTTSRFIHFNFPVEKVKHTQRTIMLDTLKYKYY